MRLLVANLAFVVLCVGCGPAIDVDSGSESSGSTSTTGPTVPPPMTGNSPVTTAQPTSPTTSPPIPSTTGPQTATDVTESWGSGSSGFIETTSGQWGSSSWGSGSSGEPDCGNGDVEPGEQCDGSDLQGLDCVSLGLGDGELGCAPQCVFDTSACSDDPGPADCLDGVVQPGEQCDGLDLQGFTCSTLGLGQGELACTLNCTFDTSACDVDMTCGNGVIEPGEQCDGDDLQGLDCPSLGLGEGELACSPGTCILDVSGCDV